MTPLIITMVLGAAILHATWNALVKTTGRPEFTMTGMRIVAAGVGLAIILFVPPPAPESWIWLFASVVIHNIYYFTLAKSYRVGDLSQVYPIFRGLAPVLVAIGATIAADELLPLGAMIGIVLISIGIASLAFERSNNLLNTNKSAVVWGLITSILIALYTVADGLGVRSAESRLGYIGWLFLLEVVPIGLIILATQRQAFSDYWRNEWKTCAIVGLAGTTAYGLVIFAMSLGAMAIVSSLRETSVIFAALIGALFLGEPFGQRRIIAAILVAGGAILMQAML